jgi:hypothetical protein
MRRTLLLLISLCVVTFTANANNATCQQRHCIAVVDAGSSGSRVHIFAYDLDASNTPTQISELWSKKVKPGFSTIEPNQDTINTYLTNLFASAPEQNMPVYFYATAGMRLLPQPKQQVYYQGLQQWFGSQAQWQLKSAKTITGSEEGLFGWLSVNYQLGNFNGADKPLASVLDMGGASVQVTFPIENAEHINPKDLRKISIGGQNISLFVHSFLGLGQTVLSQQFLDQDSCFATGYQLPSGEQGRGDASTCQRAIAKLVNDVHEVNQIVKPALAKNMPNTWYAIGGVAALAEDKVFTFPDHQFTNDSLIQQADSAFCHQQWQDMSNQYPGNEYLYGDCLFPAYYYALMVDGYGIQPEQPINYLGADWSLGVVLHQQ